MDKVLLIDGMNAMWRANIKLPFAKTKPPPRATDPEWGPDPEPQPVDPNKKDYVTTFNFFRNLRPIIELFQPDKCFFVLDGHSKARYALYPAYKANRIIKYASKKEETDLFNEQRAHIIRLIKLFPITTVRAADYEADDVIASLANSLKDEEVIILSNDSDFIQLLQLGYKNLKIYNPIKKVFQQAPEYHYLAWKSLSGDKSDNISGLVGDKKAQTLITNPEKFEKFMELEENRANFAINKKLIEFHKVPDDQLIMEEGQRDWDVVRQEFNAMEFNSITNSNSWKKYVDTFSCLKY